MGVNASLKRSDVGRSTYLQNQMQTKNRSSRKIREITIRQVEDYSPCWMIDHGADTVKVRVFENRRQNA
jgi:hypothetical protein